MMMPGMGEIPVESEDEIWAEKVRRIFELDEDGAPWMEDYWTLRAEGWSPRQAIYIIWASQPADRRQPKTQQELATQVLGLSSDRAIRRWREKNPAIEARIARLTVSALAKARAEIYAALIAAASNPNPRAHADRKLALEMLGDYVQRQTVGIGISLPDDLERMSTEELKALLAAVQSEAEDED